LLLSNQKIKPKSNLKLIKKLLIIIFILLSILTGCGYAPSYNNSFSNYADFTDIKKHKDVKNNLDELTETLPNLDYDAAIEQYSKLLPKDMSITKFKYFVIFSTLPPEETYSLIDNDVRNTITAVLNNYASVKPKIVTPVFLFGDFDSYKNFSLSNFDIAEADLSPYGFYKISKNVISIRYITWKGSISHELTHSLLQNDFPDMPSWFNEGFASLHEKATYRDGNLQGDFSWTLISLRRALSENTYTGLRQMMGSNDDEIYGKRGSYYYAQGRYLLMYLQEKGLLKDYYRQFRETYEKDSTGITQLEKILHKNLDEIDKDYLDYIQSFKE